MRSGEDAWQRGCGKEDRDKRIEHRPVVGPLPGQPGSASSLRMRPGTLLRKQIPVRTEHWDVTIGLHRGRHRGALRRKYGRRVLLEPDSDRCAYPVDGDPRGVQSRPARRGPAHRRDRGGAALCDPGF